MLVYDISSRESFNSVKKWLFEVDCLADPGIPKILIGNKNDIDLKYENEYEKEKPLEREVKYDEGKVFAKEHGMKFMEVSAKTGCNVSNCFMKLTKDMIARAVVDPIAIANKPKGFNLEMPSEVKKPNCCFC